MCGATTSSLYPPASYYSVDERVDIAESGTFALVCPIILPPGPRGLRGPIISSAETEKVVCSAGTEVAVQL